MIYDCFSFFNELDLLEIRLNVLSDVVDRFVLVESRKTHTGIDKPLYFEESKERFEPFLDKIIHIVVDDFPVPPDGYTPRQASWMRENHQRNCILKGLADAKPSDLILISDLDEIPSPDAVRKALSKKGVITFEQLFFNFYFNYLNYVRPYWPGTKALRYSELLSPETYSRFENIHYVDSIVNDIPSPTKIRYLPIRTIIKRGGWHFSYLGGSRAIVHKIKSIAIEYANENTLDEAWIAAAVEKGIDVTGCGGRFFAIPVDRRLPRYFVENQSKYSECIYRPSREYMKKTCVIRILCFVRGWLRINLAKAIPKRFKPFLFKVYCRCVKNPITV